MKRLALVAVLAVGTAGFWGCGPKHPQTVNVRGTVTLDGRPLTRGTVRTVPNEGRSARGTIQSDGTFVLSTYEEEDGAVPGHHDVTVVSRAPVQNSSASPDDVAMGASPSLIPLRYGEIGASGLTFRVEQGKENVMNLKLSSR